MILKSNQNKIPANCVNKKQFVFLRQSLWKKSAVSSRRYLPYVNIHNGIPSLDKSQINVDKSYHKILNLDSLGRCQGAIALLGKETMPHQKRKSISHIKPSGWVTAVYNCIKGRYLFNRAHLIGYQLAGALHNINSKENLITGTRYLNVEGMLPIENEIARYIKGTGHHVLYCVIPVFFGKELVCRGVLMQARSIEDDDLMINMFCLNIQPGVVIEYQTGNSREV